MSSTYLVIFELWTIIFIGLLPNRYHCAGCGKNFRRYSAGGWIMVILGAVVGFIILAILALVIFQRLH